MNLVISPMFLLTSDTSGGNALNVQRTVKDLIAAGAAGCFLEVLLLWISFANDDGNTELFLPFMAIHQLIEIDFSSGIKHGQRSVVRITTLSLMFVLTVFF
jgi:hypothetical protein